MSLLRSDAEWPHIRPDFLDVGEAILTGSLHPFIPPTRRILAVRRPYRVLLFVVDDDLEPVLGFNTHATAPSLTSASRKSASFLAQFGDRIFDLRTKVVERTADNQRLRGGFLPVLLLERLANAR